MQGPFQPQNLWANTEPLPSETGEKRDARFQPFCWLHVSRGAMRAVPTRAAADAAPEARPASQRAVAGLGPRPALQPPRPRIPTAAPATAASPTVRGSGCGAGGGGGGETGSWAARLTGRGRGSPLLSVPTCAPSPRPRFLKSFPAPEAPPGGGPHLCRCHPGPCRGARHRLGRGGYASRIPERPPGLILPDIQLRPNAIIFGAK